MQNLSIVQPGATKTRRMRNPSFPLQGGIQPMGLYPYFFTPVLPGETLDKHTLKNTLVSPPVKSPLAGAWAETWLFYVRITDIDPVLSEMFIGTLTSTAGFTAPADRPRYFTKSGQIDWLYLATQRIHETFFINEDETVYMHPDGVPMIKRINTDAYESTVFEETPPGPEALGDPEGEPISDQLYAYMRMRQMGMGVTSYEDYLKTYGLKSEITPKRGDPELISYRRYWTLPSNVINPTDGSPSGAWYWRIDETNDKPKRFLEPGFLIGYHVVRPKLLDANIKFSLSSSLWGFQDWIPSYSLQDPAAGIRAVDAGAQPWITTPALNTKTVMFDHRDLLAHGEQMRNGGGRYTAPVTTFRDWGDASDVTQLRGEYVKSADLTALWADPSADKLDYDGICTVHIKGHVTDNT